MIEGPEYTELSPAARAYLQAVAAYEEAHLAYLLRDEPEADAAMRARVLDLGEARDAAYWRLSEQERADVARAQQAHIRRLTQAIQEGT